MTEQSTAVNKTNGQAIVSLVFGILGLIGICPIIGSIVAIVTGSSVRDDGMAKAGVILGWIGLSLTALVGIVMLFLVPLFGSSDPEWHEFEHPEVESVPVPVNPR